ncbi:MAG: phospholipase D-like domain-containing protein [Actinomycetota bacterium]|nr:phospholipase D-like domain-containing protein [Actinomycetota bacterium]
MYAVFDELANAGQPKEFKRFPEEINLLRFRRVSGPLGAINPRSAHRDHRNLLAVDGRVAFVGGFNIGDLYTTWRGTHLRVRGDEAHDVERAFVDFWNTHRSEDLPKIQPVRESSWDPSTVLLVNDPYRYTLPIRDSYLATIDRANERVYLTTAYFTPGPAYREALLRAAERGVDVQVLFPQDSNHALVDWLARPYLGELLRGGVRIFMYKDFMLHAKTATADGVWATVGSANVDTLSFFGLHETNLEVYSERLAAQMERMFELDKTNAEEVTLEKWEGRALPVKVLEWGIAPLRVFG